MSVRDINAEINALMRSCEPYGILGGKGVGAEGAIKTIKCGRLRDLTTKWRKRVGSKHDWRYRMGPYCGSAMEELK